MHGDEIADVLSQLGIRTHEVGVLKDLPYGNCSWLVKAHDARRVVLRRYHDQATEEDLAYEHAVLRHMRQKRWVVPEPVSDLVRTADAWWCLTRFVPGVAVIEERPDQRRQRGNDLARLHLALRELDQTLGQRSGWQAQHNSVSVLTDVDWDAEVQAFSGWHPGLAEWVGVVAEESTVELRSVGAAGLPTLVVHGDFHEGNVHYKDGRLAGVIDFGLTHVDSRPYELAIARTYRSPEVVEAYRETLARQGWPLNSLEEACIGPIHRAFRLSMVAWQLAHGRRVGTYDTAMIERQLGKAGFPAP